MRLFSTLAFLIGLINLTSLSRCRSPFTLILLLSVFLRLFRRPSRLFQRRSLRGLILLSALQPGKTLQWLFVAKRVHTLFSRAEVTISRSSIVIWQKVNVLKEKERERERERETEKEERETEARLRLCPVPCAPRLFYNSWRRRRNSTSIASRTSRLSIPTSSPPFLSRLSRLSCVAFD